MTVESDINSNPTGILGSGSDALLDLNLFYIRQIGASLRKHVGIQDKLEREIKLRDGASRMLSACTHEDQLLEVAKTLHTSNARMYTYMAELQKLKTAEIMEKAMDEDGITAESKVCTGRVAISDIRIPLMWNDPERFSGAKVKEASRYAVFCLVRVGSEVQDTELVCMDKTTTDLSFRDVLVFEDSTHNFKMELEIHAFPMSEESISAPTPQKLLARLNRSIGKSEGKRIRDRLKESPAANMKMGPQYEKLGSLTLDLRSVDDHIRSHDITKIKPPTCSSLRSKPLLPLYGSLTCRLVAQPKCMTEKSITGFLHCMEIGSGLPCWSYMWCEVKAGKLQCWLNPEDTSSRKSQNCIDLIALDVKINEIEKARQKRPNSFQVRDVEHRHLFSAGSKEEMTNWIKKLRQHRSDYAAWSVACVPEENGPQPMFIASPTCKTSSNLLFDSSVRKTLIYEQMSMESPTKSEAVEVSDMLRRVDSTPQGSGTVESNQSSTPWAGLFSGRSSMKVTKLKDVQNITSDDSRPTKKSRPRSKTNDMALFSRSKNKDNTKPEVPRRPSDEVLKERKKLYVKPLTPSKQKPRIEDLKNFESCSETGLSDFCQSSDDVFLSSDENLLNSSGKKKSGSVGKIKSKKKRRAPQPPGQNQPESSHCMMSTRSKSKTSLSSASSLDDILEMKREPRKPPRPAVSARSSQSSSKSNNIYVQSSDPDGRRSQLSLASNSTQASNTSSGYKSDTEGPTAVPMSPSNSTDKRQLDCEVMVTADHVKSRIKGRTGVKVLPTELPTGIKLTPNKSSRSQSWDSDSVLKTNDSHSSDEASRMRYRSTPLANSSRKPTLPTTSAMNKTDKLVMQMLTPDSKPNKANAIVPAASLKRPTATPRRSYLTAVESSKIVPPDTPSYGTRLTSSEDPDYQEIEDIHSTPIPKARRTPPIQLKPMDEESEPIYAQVDLSKKTPKVKQNGGTTARKIGVGSYTKSHSDIISVRKQMSEDEEAERLRKANEDDTVYV